MPIHVWGTDYHRTSSEVRTRLFLPIESRKNSISDIIRLGFQDLLYVHTCNRVEFYTTASDHFQDTRHLWERLLHSFGMEANSFHSGYHLEGKSALRHLVRVASSLNSMVIGETQILGQLKNAHQWTKDSDLPICAPLDRAFQLAFQTAKKIRTETAIGEKPVSIATLAISSVQENKKELPLEHVVLIGRSPMVQAILNWLLKQERVPKITWVNRNQEKLAAEKLSQDVHTQSLEQFLSSPGEFTHLITATSSHAPILGRDFFSKLSARPMLFIDLAHPADISRDVSFPNHKIVRLEDLEIQAESNREERTTEIERAVSLLESALREFYLSQKETPLLKEFGEVEPSVISELEESINQLDLSLSPDLKSKVEKWATQLVKKNFHLSRDHLRRILRKAADASTSHSHPM